jgi:hypothetical protein
MPPIVIPHVCRFAVRGTIHDRPWANIWDILVDTGRPAADTVIQQTAVDLLDNVATHFASLLGGQYYVRDCVWLDLDSLGGGTGSINDTPTKTFPYQGVVGGDVAPGNVAILAIKNTVGGRSARNGRTFIPGMPESSMTGNVLSAAQITAWTTALGNFRTAMEAASGGVDRVMGVVSRPAAGPPSFNPMLTLTVSDRLATLRRRLRA